MAFELNLNEILASKDSGSGFTSCPHLSPSDKCVRTANRAHRRVGLGEGGVGGGGKGRGEITH